MDDAAVSLRFAVLLEAYLRGCGRVFDDLIRQVGAVTALQSVAGAVKQAKPADRKEALQNALSTCGLPNQFQLALSPKMTARGLMADKCRYMDSKKVH